MFRRTHAFVVLAVLVLVIAACGNAIQQTDSQRQAQDKALQHEVYVPKNDIEFNNYNDRQVLADDPTTILWCTGAFPVTGSPLFTVPIVGKLTSGTKRPYPTDIDKGNDEGMDSYYPELPGPDGMYGPSDSYRYGFTPGHKYWDYTNISMVCTDEPAIWQKEATTLVLDTDPQLLEAQVRAQAALAEGNRDEAERILAEAIKQAGGS